MERSRSRNIPSRPRYELDARHHILTLLVRAVRLVTAAAGKTEKARIVRRKNDAAAFFAAVLESKTRTRVCIVSFASIAITCTYSENA